MTRALSLVLFQESLNIVGQVLLNSGSDFYDVSPFAHYFRQSGLIITAGITLAVILYLFLGTNCNPDSLLTLFLYNVSHWTGLNIMCWLDW